MKETIRFFSPAKDFAPALGVVVLLGIAYRIRREALRNAFSHARAQHIEAELIYAERVFRLRIRDDGKGIEAALLEEGRPGPAQLLTVGCRVPVFGGRARKPDARLVTTGNCRPSISA
jgi:signal transduction histidine kinase